MNISDLRSICSAKHIKITVHATKRLEQREILLRDIITCIQTGEIIEQYPDDYPYPSCLILGHNTGNSLMHIVIGMNETDLFLITAYFPDTNKWENDFKTRKEN
ncbi:MAG: DUF4258 domain-containing protein [Lachnospiraceae bacterium]|nr:DUF4258 domain-containing protein [Lachnospiraceae bacterium]